MILTWYNGIFGIQEYHVYQNIEFTKLLIDILGWRNCV